jgi:hypothetical protein
MIAPPVSPAARVGGRLRRSLARLVRRAAATPGADRYRKHFPAEAHLWILLEHVWEGRASLRQTHGRLVAAPGKLRRLRLARGISRSQLTRSAASRDPACAERLLADLVALARRAAARDVRLRALLQVQAVDSTFVALSAKLAPWSRHGRHAPGVRLHGGFDVAGGIPATLRLTGTDVHDARALDERDLAALAGWTLLIDLGYYGHARFARLRAAGVSFPCPLHAQATYRVDAERPVAGGPTAAGDAVLADQEVTLGSPNNRRGAVLPRMRLVTGRNAAGEVRRFVTDRWDLTAGEVVALYRKRWQIELFWLWLKHYLGAIHPFGYSRRAVWLTVVVCAIAAVVASLAEPDRPADHSRLQWLGGVAEAILADLRLAPAPAPGLRPAPG